MNTLMLYLQLIWLRRYLEPHPVGSGAPLTERHHVLPKGVFPQFEHAPWNIVRLTLREHFIAHLLLARLFPCEPAVHAALVYMGRRVGKAGEPVDWAAIATSVRLNREAASEQQSARLRRLWDEDSEYRALQSHNRSVLNTRNWQDPVYQANQTAKIQQGRAEKFFSDPARVADAYGRQAEKMRGHKHFAAYPVNIHDHQTGALRAQGVCLRSYCCEHGLSQPHMHTTLSGDRTRPAARDNRVHHRGLFARRCDAAGYSIGSTAPALPVPHHNARPANIHRASDDAILARRVPISQFARDNPLGVRFSASALIRTARDAERSGATPRAHKGVYARYCDEDDDTEGSE